MKRMRKTVCVSMALVLALALLSGCGSDGRTDATGGLSYDKAVETLDALLTKVSVHEIAPQLDVDGIATAGDLAAELPEIDSYPLSVTGRGVVDVEIFASTEKSSPATDSNKNDDWLLQVAQSFNAADFQLDGKSVSVSIRTIASGPATDYIVSGKYVPAGFSPASEQWGEMVEAKGISLDLVEESIAGNTAGILMTAKKYEEFIEKYGEVTYENIITAVMGGELLFGYTNPYVSSTGLNALTGMLQAIDSGNPLSNKAVSTLVDFQAYIPSVYYTTAQMISSVQKGVLDAMAMEYQAYINYPDLASYVFTPLGIRHDNPVYAVEGASGQEKEVLQLFTEYCLEADQQKLASDKGFNALADYTGQECQIRGAQLFEAQQVWKDNKDAGREVAAVFVADISGSMLSEDRIGQLQNSLLNAAPYINSENYIGLISYNSQVYINLPVGQFDNQQRAMFNGAVKGLAAEGGTATNDAILVGLNMLLEFGESHPDARLMLFVLSDGEQTNGYSLDKVEPTLIGLEIPIHTICYAETMKDMSTIAGYHEGIALEADPDNVVYTLKNIFNSQM